MSSTTHMLRPSPNLLLYILDLVDSYPDFYSTSSLSLSYYISTKLNICTLLDNPAKKSYNHCKFVSPLKRLQKSQAVAFRCFGICAVTINEDTPREVTWWSVSYLFITFFMHIYLYIERKTYFPPKTAWKHMHSSLLLLLNRFSELWRVISLEWPAYYDSLHSSLSFLSSMLMKLTHSILLALLFTVYLHFSLPGENFTSLKHLFDCPFLLSNIPTTYSRFN